MKLSGDWLDHPDTKALFAAVQSGGHQIVFVGGCVRNALLGVPVGDIDLATDAPPDIVSDLCTKAGLRVVPTGISHGTVTVIARNRAHEVTTFRQDVATDGRHATVAFTADLGKDAARRDFTMNALYAQADGTVIDPLGGLPDLMARRVRFVGDPATRIAEDYLRILRFFRFHAVHGDSLGGLDADGLAACAANLSGIETLAHERIGAEIRKLLSARDPAPAVAAMAQSGVLARILPGADPRFLPVLIHLENDVAARWLRRLAILGGPDPTDALRLSREESTHLGHLRATLEGSETIAVLGWRIGETLACDSALLRAAMFETALPPNWQREAVRGAGAIFPVSAADLMPALTGAALGKGLKTLEARWLASDLSASREDLLKS
jgi:poly(A) polymerase